MAFPDNVQSVAYARRDAMVSEFLAYSVSFPCGGVGGCCNVRMRSRPLNAQQKNMGVSAAAAAAASLQ